jgi:hypothetical protein
MLDSAAACQVLVGLACLGDILGRRAPEALFGRHEHGHHPPLQRRQRDVQVRQRPRVMRELAGRVRFGPLVAAQHTRCGWGFHGWQHAEGTDRRSLVADAGGQSLGELGSVCVVEYCRDRKAYRRLGSLALPSAQASYRLPSSSWRVRLAGLLRRIVGSEDLW